jgi:hypothetical protein
MNGRCWAGAAVVQYPFSIHHGSLSSPEPDGDGREDETDRHDGGAEKKTGRGRYSQPRRIRPKRATRLR